MSRRERAIERVDAIDLEETRAWLRRDWMAAAIEAYEAELAADLESEETVRRALDAMDLEQFGRMPETRAAEFEADRRYMRAALKVALEER